MKKFIFDRLVDRENICNLESTAIELQKCIKNNQNVVIFAPRNFGKTSLIKSVVIDNYRKQNKKCFVYFCDLLGVYDMNSLIHRLLIAFESAFAESFPIKKLIENIKIYLKNLSPQLTIDPATGMPVISLGIDQKDKNYSIQYIFGMINYVAEKIPVLIVLDEFQDINNVPDAQAIFRTIFQEIHDIPIIILGSQRQLLYNMFSVPKSPLSNWGRDIEIKPINYEIYQKYMNERFLPFKLKINQNYAKKIQDVMFRVPESINILCQQIIDDSYNLKEITEINDDRITNAIKNILLNREKRFESIISSLSKVEEQILTVLSHITTIDKPLSNIFSKQIEFTSRSISINFEKLINKGFIEKIDSKFRISDPLLHYYLKYYR